MIYYFIIMIWDITLLLWYEILPYYLWVSIETVLDTGSKVPGVLDTATIMNLVVKSILAMLRFPQ